MSNKTSLEAAKICLWDQEMTLDEAFSELKDSPAAQSQILNELSKKILLEKNFRKYHINLHQDQALRESLKQKLKDSLKIKDEDSFEKFLQMISKTEQEMTDELVYQEQINKLKSIIIAPDAIKDLFLKNKSKSDRVIFSVIRVKEESLAKELYFQIKDDKRDFSEIAKNYSIGEEAKQGGIIGPQSLGSLNPELRKRLQSLKPGEITEPFSLDAQTFLILSLIKFDHIQLTPDLANKLADQLFDQWLNRQLSLTKRDVINNG